MAFICARYQKFIPANKQIAYIYNTAPFSSFYFIMDVKFRIFVCYNINLAAIVMQMWV